MIITVGLWKTRDGSKIRVFSTDGPARYPVVGFHADTAGGTLFQWGSDGKAEYPSTGDFDLLEPWVEPAKYSVELYLPNPPKLNARSNSLVKYLFSCHGFNPNECRELKHKVRVTVEEIVG